MTVIPENVVDSPVLTAAVGLVLVAFLCIRQLRPQSINEERGMRLVAVFGVIGIVQLVTAASTTGVSAVAVICIVASFAIEGLLGALRGRLVRINRTAGKLTSQGNPLTVILWIAGLVIHFGAEAIATSIDSKSTGLVGSSLLVAIALSLGVQKFATLARAKRPQTST